MILPSKHLSQSQALLTFGAMILDNLRTPKTVSSLWEEFRKRDFADDVVSVPQNYDWFILALDLLFIIHAVELEDGLLTRKAS